MRHAAHVAHHSRGRLRIRVPSAKGNSVALEAIRQSLANVSGVQEVTVNESIGTLTILYDPRDHGDFHQRLSAETSENHVVWVPPPRMADLEDVDEMIEHEVEFLAQRSHSAKAILDWSNALDQSVKRLTDNNLDLKVLVPLALAVGVFMELGVSAATPVWLTLGLFSFNHFIDLHTHPDSNGAAESTGTTPAQTNGVPATATPGRPRPRKKRFP